MALRRTDLFPMGDAFMRKQLEVNAQHTRSGMHLNGSWVACPSLCRSKPLCSPTCCRFALEIETWCNRPRLALNLPPYRPDNQFLPNFVEHLRGSALSTRTTLEMLWRLLVCMRSNFLPLAIALQQCLLYQRESPTSRSSRAVLWPCTWCKQREASQLHNVSRLTFSGVWDTGIR
jgi:hypothetical protein